MHTLSLVTWMTLWGLSLLFVGGFVLWVYGAEKPQFVLDGFEQENESPRGLHAEMARWFLLYGAAAAFAGAGLLLTAVVMIL
jgi:hypothetical protein